MNLNKFWKAFSLTELLIVVVVITVLFSAMLPIMTKRRNGSTTGNEPVWQFVSGEQRDAFFDRNVPKLSTTAYIGVDPANIPASESSPTTKYPSKVQIKANQKQHHIQFRYGTANGTLTGLFAMDNKGNTLGTGKLSGDNGENSNSILAKETNTNNTALGNGAFTHVKNSSGVTSIGANSTMGRSATATAGSETTAVGNGANQYGKAYSSVLLGAVAGKTEDGTIGNTVAVGVGSVGLPTASASKSVMAGGDTATLGAYGTGNVIMGSNYIGTSSSDYNTILGYNAYHAASSTANYMTAVGSDTCNSFLGCDSNGNCPSKKTCIGYTSGAHDRGTGSLGWNYDDLDHIFLGGEPKNYYVNGRAVLEVHNIPKSKMDKSGYVHPGGSLPDIAPTVVMNSNLVVRGNVFWSSTDGKLRSHILSTAGVSGDETGADRCDRRCHSRTGRKYWRGEECGSLIGDFLAWLGPAGSIIATMAVIAAGVAAGVMTAGMGVGVAVGGVALALAIMSEGDAGFRPKDPITRSMITFYTGQDETYACASATQNYPVKDKTCPNLNLGLTSSDIRLKENISENKDAIEKLMFIMPYDYTFKADKNKRPQVGVIAQDLQTYFPNSIAKDKDGYLNIRLDEMFFASINTVKNLDKIVQNLEADVTVLENDTNKLSKEQKSIQKRIKELNNRAKKLEK